MDNITSLHHTLTPSIDFDSAEITIEERMESPFSEIIGNHYKLIVRTQDDMIRKGLIELGWTPPPD